MPTHLHAEGRAPISKYDRWLIVIGCFKLLEAALFVLLGISLLRMLHKDLVGEVARLISALRFDPQGRLASLFLDKVALVSPHRLKEISVVVFADGALDVLEGVGLILRKMWAEYVTLVASALFLPVEFYGIVRHVTWLRICIAVVNVVVVIYLSFHLRMRMRKRELAGN